jgi:4-hydroxybenzoyl-CoA reductase subunit alpha
MNERISITLNVNSRIYTASVAPSATLVEVLRYDLGLTGTKRGCDKGLCGACTVLIDGVARPSCLELAARCQQAAITTIEGLVAPDGSLHPLQRSFIEHGAIQCGYCTPGMVLSAYALIQRNPRPSDAQIRAALGGNLCRCTGYKRILDAVKDFRNFKKARPRPVEHPDDLDRYATVGRSRPRVDAADKVTGRAVYTDDIAVAEMLFGAILHSPIAHGRIKSIDTSEAEELDGVRAVITADDVPDVLYGVSPARYDEHVLARDKVRYVGDEVAAVAAVDEQTARRACELIRVEYEELPALLSVEEAYEKDAVRIHDKFERNVNTRVDHHFGDVREGFAQADLIREEKFVGNFIYQEPMEPHCSISRWEHDGTLVIHTATQVPHYLHHMMARVLDMPLGSIRVVRPTVGGGFGGKAETTPLDFLSAILARRTGRAVKMRYTREEMHLHHRGRHEQHMTMKLGLTREGRITAFESEIFLDGGAYTSFGIITAYYAGSMMPTLYHIPNYKYDGYRMYTNKPACGAMRGHGVPQPRWAFESLLTMMCEELGLDPIVVRELNAMDPDTRTVNDLDVRSCEFKATLRAVRERSGWDERYGRTRKGRGIGIGCGGFVSGAGYPIYRSRFPHANAVVRVTEDGTAAICMIAAAEIGQGSDTVLSQMCAEGLGLPADRVRIKSEDTDIGPIDLGAYSSRVTLMGGNAVARAGRDALSKILPYAATELKCGIEDLTARDGLIFCTGEPERSMEWSAAAHRYFQDNGPLVGTGCYSPPKGLGGAYKGAAVGTSPAYSFGSSVCELAVDLETGKVTVERFTDFHDCGTPINPMAVHGQVEGAIVMGASETLLEEVRFDDEGRLLTPDLHDYVIASIHEAPEIFSGLVDSYEPEGPYGAKEIGEGSTLPVLGAVAHAVAMATGVWIKKLPITPERIVEVLGIQREGGPLPEWAVQRRVARRR